MTNLIRTDAEVPSVRRLGESHTICIVFAGNTLLSNVKVGYIRYTLWAHKIRALQFQKCHKLVHVTASCTNGQRGTKCAVPHGAHERTLENQKCISCTSDIC